MELHHSKHHATYVAGINTATEKFQEAEQKGDIKAQVSLQPLINFHGGGHINHSLFWENLAPKSAGGGGEPSGALKVRSSLFLIPIVMLTPSSDRYHRVIRLLRQVSGRLQQLPRRPAGFRMDLVGQGHSNRKDFYQELRQPGPSHWPIHPNLGC